MPENLDMNKREEDLYEDIKTWFKVYLDEKYPSYEIEVTHESSRQNLETVLRKFNIDPTLAIGLQIKIDVLGILKKDDETFLAFIEVKDQDLTLKDLGQLWGYTQLMNPIESFLISSKGLGGLSKLFNVLKREDLLRYGQLGNKYMQIAQWDIRRRVIDYSTLIPK